MQNNYKHPYFGDDDPMPGLGSGKLRKSEFWGMGDNGNMTLTECLTYFASGFLFGALGFLLAYAAVYFACTNT